METIVAGAFGLLIGIVGLWTGFMQLRNRAILNRWNTTKGKVIERGTYEPNVPTLSAPAFKYAPLVRYGYQTNGEEFVNDCIHPKRIQMPELSAKKRAQKRAESFADEVTVYYNPENPSESFLVQTSKRKLYVWIGCSCAALLFGAMFLLTG